ncbi:MAG TPA: TRAP transporter substrate-binding protein [Burkholderiaceae bacterium]|nr:TRAP transporter substrate-binding protein [Burkholderiaceae bacterium]
MSPRPRLVSRSTLVAWLCAAGLAPPLSHAQDKMVFKAADVHPPGYPTVVAVESMGKKLSQQTGGRITFQMFPNSVLGGEKEMIEQTQVGAIQIARISLGPLGPVVPAINVFNMPFVFRDVKHMRAVIDGPVGQELLDKVSASPAKLIGLAWMDGGSRSLITKKPVRKPEDLKGQKIRVIGNPVFVDMMNAMGGNGISMGYNEVFTALQTGVIDGCENNAPSYYTQNYAKAGAKSFTLTHHLIVPEILVMSKVTWDKLSATDQAAVKKAAREAQIEQRDLWDKAVADYSAKLKADGVEFIEIDNKPFYESTAPVRAKYGAQFSDLIKRIADVR